MNILFKTTVLAASLLLVACNNNDDQESNCTNKPIKILSNENALPTSTRLKKL
jgi:major membrane immunogen (membrane-anchored lipoprotein)